MGSGVACGGAPGSGVFKTSSKHSSTALWTSDMHLRRTMAFAFIDFAVGRWRQSEEREDSKCERMAATVVSKAGGGAVGGGAVFFDVLPRPRSFRLRLPAATLRFTRGMRRRWRGEFELAILFAFTRPVPFRSNKNVFFCAISTNEVGEFGGAQPPTLI